VLYYFLSCFPAFLFCSHCLLLLHSHRTSTKYSCVTSVTAIHSSIPLALSLSQHVTIFSIKMCLPMNDTNKCVG
jgi:hypothetical protein